MAAPTERCVLCGSELRSSYRSLKTASSRIYKPFFEEMGVTFRGKMCMVCTNKLNRVAKIDEDILMREVFDSSVRFS